MFFVENQQDAIATVGLTESTVTIVYSGCYLSNRAATAVGHDASAKPTTLRRRTPVHRALLLFYHFYGFGIAGAFMQYPNFGA